MKTLGEIKNINEGAKDFLKLYGDFKVYYKRILRGKEVIKVELVKDLAKKFDIEVIKDELDIAGNAFIEIPQFSKSTYLYEEMCFGYVTNKDIDNREFKSLLYNKGDRPVFGLYKKGVKGPEVYYAIIEASMYKYKHYGWVTNKEEPSLLRDFKKRANSAADRLADRHFYEHAGGSIVKVYPEKDVDKFVAHYFKLTGAEPKLD